MVPDPVFIDEFFFSSGLTVVANFYCSRDAAIAWLGIPSVNARKKMRSIQWAHLPPNTKACEQSIEEAMNNSIFKNWIYY